ncbi:MAG TPA: flagellar motor switch protein FliN [Pirellulales bacterium]|jgi:flagellar motor switch protein FliN/FliY
MADSGPIGQNDIDALLKQAQAPASGVAGDSGAAKAFASAAAPPAAAQNDSGTAVSQADIDKLLNQAEQGLNSVNPPASAAAQSAAVPAIKPFKLADFNAGSPSVEVATLDLIRDVELDLRIELGRTHMHLEDVLKLSKGSVVTLDKLAGDPVDIFVNGRLIARGEVLILNENFCVRVAELVAPENTSQVA